MHDAIVAQPAALATVVAENAAALATAARAVRERECVVLTGIGTSWHAALVGEHLLATAGRLGTRARAVHAFDFARYWPEPDSATVSVVVTHSGSSGDARRVIERISAAGGLAIALTGRGVSALDSARILLRTVEQEHSGAHTASYTAALALLVALAAAAGHDPIVTGLPEVANGAAALISAEAARAVAARLSGVKRWHVIGGGPNTATALEAAMKIGEAAHVPAVGWNCEQFLHGPWASMEAADALVVISPPGPSHARALTAARIATMVGAPVVALVETGDRQFAPFATATIELPAVDERLSPILAIIPLQQLAYHLALVRGVNPDAVRTDEPPYRRARTILDEDRATST